MDKRNMAEMHNGQLVTDPTGVEFVDIANHGRQMKYVTQENHWTNGWLPVPTHPSAGNWVTLRKATADDIEGALKTQLVLCGHWNPNAHFR